MSESVLTAPYKNRQSKETLLQKTNGAHARDTDSSGELPDSGTDDEKHRPKLTDAQWWRAEEKNVEPHKILDNIVQQIEADQQGRYDAYREYERLFGSAVGVNGDESFRSIATDNFTQNELQSSLETLWAQIFKNRIVPAVSTSEADWEEWDKARAYGRWLEGAFDDARVYSEAWPQAGINMLVHGTGIVRVGWEKVDDKTARVITWSVNPRFFMVDRLEGKHGKPRSIYFKDHIDRYRLFDTYKEDRKDFYGTPEERMAGIDSVTGNDDIELGVGNTTKCDMLTVREAWHLPSGPDADDGCHAIWIKGCTLVYEKFTWDTFPCMFMRYGCPMEGFYGESAVRKLAPSQKRLDKLTMKIDESQDVMGVPRIIVGSGAGVLKTEHIDDIPGAIIECDNINQIRDWNAQCATGELYKDRDDLPRSMRALLGVSDFEAQQQLPQGLRDVSGAMLERWVDQGAARHAMTHAQAEDGIVTLADLFMRQAEECQKLGYDVVYMGPGETSKTSIEELRFKDVHVERKRLRLRVQPMSQLPQTFAGKVDAIGKIEEKFPGAISPKTVLRMLEVPDLATTSDMLVSDEEIIMKNLSYMCRTGEYLAPMPFDNLDLIIQLTTRYINRYRVREGRDLSKVALLAQYIDDAVQAKKGFGTPDPNAPPTPSTMAALGGAGAMPQGPAQMPMPAPQGPPGPPPGMPPPGMAPPPAM
jgi:hypothetical protein